MRPVRDGRCLGLLPQEGRLPRAGRLRPPAPVCEPVACAPKKHCFGFKLPKFKLGCHKKAACEPAPVCETPVVYEAPAPVYAAPQAYPSGQTYATGQTK